MIRVSHVVAALSLSIAASACSAEPVGRDADSVDFDRSTSSALVDYGILDLVNDPSTDEAFLDYWMNTSIFARTVEDDKRDEIRAKGKAHLAGKSAPFVITKRVAVAICIR